MWLDTKYDKIADWKRNQLNIRAVGELRYQTRNYPSFTLLHEKKRIQSVHICQPSIYIYLLLRYWWYQSSLTFSCLISKVLQNWQTQAQIIWSKYFFSITWTIHTCDTSSFFNKCMIFQSQLQKLQIPSKRRSLWLWRFLALVNVQASIKEKFMSW